MTNAETAKIVEKIDRAYPSYWKGKDPKGVLEVWREAFADAPYECVDAATNEYLRREKMPPTIADIFQRAVEIYDERNNYLT